MIIKRETRGDKIFSVCVYILLALVCLIVIYPLYYMLSLIHI